MIGHQKDEGFAWPDRAVFCMEFLRLETYYLITSMCVIYFSARQCGVPYSGVGSSWYGC